MAVADFSKTIVANAAPSKVWEALVDPEKVAQYHLAPLREIELREGGRIAYGTESDEMIVGRVLRVEIGRRLDHTFRFHPNQEGTKNDTETVVSYVIEAGSDGTVLTLLHSGFVEENQTYANICGGWPFILDALKAFVEG